MSTPSDHEPNQHLPVRTQDEAAGRSQQQPGQPDPHDQRRIVDVEVLGPHDEPGAGSGQNSGRGTGPAGGMGGGADPFEAFRQARPGGNPFGGAESFGGMGASRLLFTHIRGTGGREQNTCLAPAVTLALFLVCLAQFGFLAGIGFIFFHIVGSVAGSVRQMRALMAGGQPNPWFWRLSNWFVCFFLTAWFSGALD